ncbi:MAG: NAD+ synthase [Burkholderiaceae bacterium]|nr:NAD+ synthase [Burkholderiaceae bacterium]
MSVKIAIAQMNCTVGDLDGNRKRILDFAQRAAAQGASVVVTPELSLTGYPPEDLLLSAGFYDATQSALSSLAKETATLPYIRILVGHHLMRDGNRYNACSILQNGCITDTYCKHDLPNYAVFDEKRYFTSCPRPLVFSIGHVRFGINICEDVWSASAPALAREAGADVLLVPNGSPYHMNKSSERYVSLREHVSKQGMAAVYVNMVGGQDELVFDGSSFALDSKGNVRARMNYCEENMAIIPFDGKEPRSGHIAPEPGTEEAVYRALVLGARDYIEKNGFPGAIIGLSGGVDSALTLAIATDAIGTTRTRAVMMPSPYTADISKADAQDMAQRLRVRYDVLPIDACFSAFRHTLSEQFSGLDEDTTEENIQSRIRGTLLMALSNKTGAIVLTTGNKSELAVGYSTLYGDMAGGFAVIRDIPKTLVYRLCRYRNSLSDIIPERVLTRAPSAELKANQTDQDSLPPYETLDTIIHLFIEEGKSAADIVAAGHDRATVARVTAMIRRNEFKRRQAPIGIRITPRAFGRDWRYPVTSKYRDN